MEKRRSRYQTLRWQLARERIGQLVRESCRVDQEMSPRLAALVKKLDNGSPELSIEMFRVPDEKQEGTSASRLPERRFPPPWLAR
jgi:hypothetical protein